MLVQLRIRNFAIIDEIELELPAGFTVITGETGAGKSILVNALNLVLGGRASSNVVRAGAQTAEVEALFDISGQPVVRARLEQRELVGDDPNILLVRRVVGQKGRGKVVVNGSLATVASLAEVVRGLVDISGQHDQQSLLVVESHLDILDAYGQVEGIRFAYRERFDNLTARKRERAALERSEEESLKRADYLRFQLEEIERLSPEPGEDDELEAERRRLGHAEKLKGGAEIAESLLYGEDGSAFDKLGKATAEIESLAHIDPTLAPTCDSLASARREIEEASRVLQHYSQQIEDDPARLEQVEARVAELQRLCRKHGGDLSVVLARGAQISQEIAGLDDAEARLEELSAEIATLEEEVLASGIALTKTRKRAGKKLAKSIVAELDEMELEEASFNVRLEPRKAAGEAIRIGGRAIAASGMDEVEFLWSANTGEPERPLAKIASGGELSRLMLAVKTVLASRDLVSLYVFDEVDTGLGGRAADSIGRKIQTVAGGHQAITITHLAPIAARADHHLSACEKPRSASSSGGKSGPSRIRRANGDDGAHLRYPARFDGSTGAGGPRRPRSHPPADRLRPLRRLSGAG